MATYVILSRISPDVLSKPKDFKGVAAKVSARIKAECPGVTWRESYVVLGRFDVVDIVDSNDPKQIEKAVMIIRTEGHSWTETMVGRPWKDFLAEL